MEYRDWYFKTKRVWLCKHTPFIAEFMRHLHSKGLLDPDTQAVVESHPGPSKKCEVLYDHLVQFGPHKIQDIIQCLELSLMKHIADVFMEYIPIHGDRVEESAQTSRENSSVWFEVGQVTHNFVGRQNELNDIHKLLSASHNKHLSSRSSPRSIVSLVGRTGIGKSTLARKYACVFREFCDGNVIWINAESQDSIRASFVRLGNYLELEVGPQTCNPELTAKAFHILKGRKCLYIYDDVRDLEIFNQFRPNIDDVFRGSRVLVTCTPRIDLLAIDQSMENVVRLGILSVAEAVQLVQKQLPKTLDTDASNLAAAFNGCPLTLQQATACISRRYNNHENAIQMYQADFEISQKSLLECEKFNAVDFYSLKIWTTCTLSIETIKQIPGFESAVKLVQMLSYINDEMLTMKSLVAMFGDQLQPSLKLLGKFSLAQIYHARIEIARPVQDSIKASLTAAEKESLMEIFIC